MVNVVIGVLHIIYGVVYVVIADSDDNFITSGRIALPRPYGNTIQTRDDAR